MSPPPEPDTGCHCRPEVVKVSASPSAGALTAPILGSVTPPSARPSGDAAVPLPVSVASWVTTLSPSPEPTVSGNSISRVDGSWDTVPLPTIEPSASTRPSPETTLISRLPPSTVRLAPRSARFTWVGSWARSA